jgi:hypothetical protein
LVKTKSKSGLVIFRIPLLFDFQVFFCVLCGSVLNKNVDGIDLFGCSVDLCFVSRTFISMPALAQLCQHTITAFGMYKSYPCSVCAVTGNFIDHPRPLLLHLGDGCLNILHLIGDMMDTGAVLFHELCYRTLWTGGLQQLYFGLTDLKHGNLYLLLGYFFLSLKFHPKRIPVKREGSFQGLHGYANMVNFL